MPTYISLVNFTDQGIRNVKKSPDRQSRFTEHAQQAGSTVHAIYMTLDGYAAAIILDLPDDEAAARSLLALGCMGNVRTHTMKAFPRAQFEQLVQSL